MPRPALAPPDLGPPDLGLKPRAPEPSSRRLPGVDRIIAVASGKGGVGKSTAAANLAVALAARGRRLGLLDADVYGPSHPRMLGVSARTSSPDGHIILPLRNHGVTLMSMGLLTGEDEALVWGGPMLMGALQQMLGQMQWGRLDVLLVDLPPGTGDVQMRLCQKAEVSGAVIVSTPQDIALIDARKGIDMFRRIEVPILGLIENMSAFVCPTCGTVHRPFGHGGARAEADKLGVPFLGETRLIEIWSRRTMFWINRFVDDGFAPLHQAWVAKCDAIGGQVTGPEPGKFLGLDEADHDVFERPADAGEWATPGALEFSNWTGGDLAVKRRRAFANGWLGLESLGRATFVAVAAISDAEVTALTDRLAAHFVAARGAPSLDAARPLAAEELGHMREMCEDHSDNTLLTVSRELVEAGVREQVRFIGPQDASLTQFAVHGS